MALALALIGSAQAGVKEQLQTRYAAWDAAYRKRDVKAMASLLHPRFKLITADGSEISRVEYVAILWRATAPITCKTKLLTIKPGKKGVVYSRTEERSSTSAEAEHRHKYRDTWAKVRGHWLLLESRTLSESKVKK